MQMILLEWIPSQLLKRDALLSLADSLETDTVENAAYECKVSW